MLADVRVLCIDRRRVPRERLQPVWGERSVVRRRDPGRNQWVPIAVLSSSDSVTELPALDQVRIARWFGVNLMLVGVEHVGRLKQGRPQVQAWWVQLVASVGAN
jgi:hypothetical protein